MTIKLLKCGFCSSQVPWPSQPHAPSVMCPKCFHVILLPSAAAVRSPAPSVSGLPQRPSPSKPVQGAKLPDAAGPSEVKLATCRVCRRLLPNGSTGAETCPSCVSTSLPSGTLPTPDAKPSPPRPLPSPSPAKMPLPNAAPPSPVSKSRTVPPQLNRLSYLNRRVLIGAGLAVIVLASTASVVALLNSEKPKVPGPLDFVRTDADFILHFRVADIWNSAVIQDFYNQIPVHMRRQSEDTIARLGLGMEHVSSLTITLSDPDQPAVCAVVTTNRPFTPEDGQKILAATPEAASVKWKSHEHRGLKFEVGSGHAPGTPDTPLAIYAASETLFLLGTELGVRSALDGYLDMSSLASVNRQAGNTDPSRTPKLLDWVRPWLNDTEYLFVGAGARTTNVNQVFQKLHDPATPEDVRERLKAQPGISGLMMSLSPGEQVPPELQQLLATDSAMIALKLDADNVLHIQGQSHYPSPDQADDCKDLVNGLLKVIQLMPAGVAGTPTGPPQAEPFAKLSTFVRGIRVESQESFVKFSAKQPLSALTLDVANVVSWADGWHGLEMTSAPNLEQLAGAFEQYHNDYAHYPPAVIMDASGTQPLHSWRVAILPYLGREAVDLHREFQLDKPWNCPHNLALSQKMPAVFEHPLARMHNQRTIPIDGVLHGMTPYQLPVGSSAAFFEGRQLSKREIVDGLDQTIMILEQQPLVSWTSPQDVPVAAGKAVQDLLKSPSIVPGAPLVVVLFDGTSRPIDRTISDATFWGMLTPNDGLGIPAD